MRSFLSNDALRWSAKLVTMIALLWAGYVTIDERYARAGEVREQFGTINRTLKEGQYQQARNEEITLRREAEKRRLSDFERRRLEEVTDNRKRLEYELQKR